ncbi:MAG: RNA-dependent RNA polymerase [Guiyang lispivirus 2]|uniref:RNA-directed RNA polymerase L n=1 Tax=Guiyang lispivirus 2 TaxID=2905571 RepID=A0AAX2ZQT0_9MONO|nr:MAG: RNA-dependent RNA polymerase [Guiyang lispivirus 2]UHK03042.1 MAG: RNA-dependent RNA polymerase [Guiyang lispivirus 2]
MEDQDLLDELCRIRKVPHLADSHLQSPILRDEREHFVRYWSDTKYACPRHITLQADKVKRMKVVNVTSPRVDSEVLYGDILSGAMLVETTLNVEGYFQQARTQALLDVGAIVRGLGKEIPTLRSSLSKIYSKMTTGTQCPELVNLGVSREVWDKLRLNMAGCRAKPNNPPIQGNTLIPGLGRCRYICTSGFLLVSCRAQWWILDYEQILCLVDTILSRQLALLYISLAKDNDNIYVPKEDVLLAAYGWGDVLLQQLGNNAFKLIKYWESLILGNLLEQVDTWSQKSKFLMTMMADYHITRGEFSQLTPCTPERPCEFCQFKRTTLDKLDNPFVLSELFGVYRHWGHPTVELRAGCTKVQKIATSTKVISLDLLDEVTGQFVQYFVISYIRRHGHWPKVNLERLPESSHLRQLAEHGIEDLSEFSEAVPLKEWARLSFLKNFEFDFSEDWILMIEDKAISPYLSDWRRVYDPTLLGELVPQGESSRRVILECLRKPSVDIKKICETIMCLRVPEEWNIVLVHAKEREMKIDPRLFAMMVLEMRLYFCVTEHNIASSIMKYFPQQTMTLGELDLIHRLMVLTKQADGEHPHISININLDFQKWNLQWRYMSVRGIALKIDELFGTPGLINYTHLFFDKCHIFSSHRFSVPDGYQPGMEFPPTSDLHWMHHKGGFEGLRQKLWTLITLNLLIVISHRCKVRFLITGQGDNQILKVMLPKLDSSLSDADYMVTYEEEILHQVDHIMNVIEDTAEKMGLPIKREETWVSHRLFAYGKELLVDGAFLPGALKKIARVYFEVNEIYPTCESKLATIHTSSQAAAQKGDNPLISYTISLMESYYSFMKDIYYPSYWGPPLKLSLPNQDKDNILHFIRFCCLFPRALGGFPVSTLLSYLYRGHPDPVTEGLCFIKILSHEIELYANALQYLVQQPIFKNTIDLTMLLQDPTAINWPNPILASNIIKNLLMDTVRENTKNKDVCMLFHLNWKDEDKKFTDCLSQAVPFSPRILNDLYMKSPSGARLGFLSTFSNMRSTQAALGDVKRSRAINLIRDSEKKWILHLYLLRLRYRKKLKPIPLPCMTELAQQLRDKSWFPDSSNSVQGVTVPHPIEQFEYIIHEDFCTKSTPYSLMIYDPEPQGSGQYRMPIRPWYSRGKFNPYLGSQTSEKKTGVLIPLPRSTPSIKAAQRISQIATWAFAEDKNTQDLLNTVISCRTNLNREVLLLSAGYVYGGSLTHRFNDPITSHEVLTNIRPNFLSHVTISSDTLEEYSRGAVDVTLHFQGMFLVGGMVLHFHCLNEANWQHRHLVHAHVRCLKCTKEIVDTPVTLPEVTLTYPSYQNCPLLYTNIQLSEYSAITPVNLIIHNAPVQLLKNIQYTAANAAACMMESNHRVIMSSSYRGRSELISCPGTRGLDIQEFIGITFPALLNQLAWACILDRAESVFEILKRSYQSVEEAYAVTVQRSPHSLWGHVRSHLVLPETRQWLIESARIYLPSSESWKGGPNLDLSLSRMLANKIKLVLGLLKSTSTIPFIWFNVGTMTYKRLLVCWSNLILIRLYLQEKIDKHQLFCALRSKPHIDPDDGSLCTKLITWLSNIPHLEITTSELINILTATRICYTSEFAETYIRKSRDLVHPMITNRIYPHLGTDSPRSPSDHMEIPFAHRLMFLHSPSELIPAPTSRAPTKITVGRFAPSRKDHMYRLHGLYSTAPYKYYDIISTYLLSAPSYAMCLAEGSGGICRMLLDKFRCKGVYYDSLIEAADFAAHRLPGYIPPEVLLSPNRNRIEGALESAEFGGDLLSLKTVRRIHRVERPPSNVITCDAEIAGDPHPVIYCRLLANVLYISSKHLHDQGILIFKTFCKFPESLCVQLSMMLRWFQNVSICVPISSSHESYEVFLVGTNPLGALKTPSREPQEFLVMGEDYLHHMPVILDLHKYRIKQFPHQEVVMWYWKDLNNIIAGYAENNWNSSIITYFGQLAPEVEISYESLMDCCDSVMQKSELLIREHIRGLGRLHAGCKISSLGRELLNVTSADRLSLGYLAIHWKNANIMKTILPDLPRYPHKESLTELIISNNIITHSHDELWVTNDDPTAWFSRYGRSFHHILGHLHQQPSTRSQSNTPDTYDPKSSDSMRSSSASSSPSVCSDLTSSQDDSTSSAFNEAQLSTHKQRL